MEGPSVPPSLSVTTALSCHSSAGFSFQIERVAGWLQNLCHQIRAAIVLKFNNNFSNAQIVDPTLDYKPHSWQFFLDFQTFQQPCVMKWNTLAKFIESLTKSSALNCDSHL